MTLALLLRPLLFIVVAFFLMHQAGNVMQMLASCPRPVPDRGTRTWLVYSGCFLA